MSEKSILYLVGGVIIAILAIVFFLRNRLTGGGVEVKTEDASFKGSFEAAKPGENCGASGVDVSSNRLEENNTIEIDPKVVTRVRGNKLNRGNQIVISSRPTGSDDSAAR